MDVSKLVITATSEGGYVGELAATSETGVFEMSAKKGEVWKLGVKGTTAAVTWSIDGDSSGVWVGSLLLHAQVPSRCRLGGRRNGEGHHPHPLNVKDCKGRVARAARPFCRGAKAAKKHYQIGAECDTIYCILAVLPEKEGAAVKQRPLRHNSAGIYLSKKA